jgi:mono/diheme cytochrome c family protein
MRHTLLALTIALAIAGCAKSPRTAVATTTLAAMDNAELLARGEYLVRIGGCNDCHTAGYAEQQGNIDRAQWLTGSPLGYRGPWGTTYAANLRLKLAGMDEAQWLAYSANLHTRPLMPDFALRAMREDDRRALYRFVRSLGPAGVPAPAYTPPGQQPAPPYLDLVLPPVVAAGPPKAG